MRCPHNSRNKKNIPFEEKFSYIVMKCALALFQLLCIFTASVSMAHVILARETFPSFIFFIISSGALYTFYKLEKEMES